MAAENFLAVEPRQFWLLSHPWGGCASTWHDAELSFVREHRGQPVGAGGVGTCRRQKTRTPLQQPLQSADLRSAVASSMSSECCSAEASAGKLICYYMDLPNLAIRKTAQLS